jgi:hypothetical protein
MTASPARTRGHMRLPVLARSEFSWRSHRR